MVKKPSPRSRKSPTKARPPAAESFPIVGIGASAGGLEAVRLLLQSLPADLGMSFVVVQHLDPRRPSALAEILAKSSTMPVKEVRSGVVVAPNAVYVIAPANDLTIKDGRLRLARRAETRAPQRPIDLFLTSLAQDSGGRAIGVILSGTGSDGSRGLKAIEEAGGLTFAQDASAAHHGMPDSAIAEECVDFVLPPQRIAAELARVARHPAWTGPPPVASPAAPLHEEPFKAILATLSASTGIDFEQYKQPTLRRRIERRMVMRQLNSLEDYLKCLRDDPAELQALHQEMLIQVTCFFRDAQVFDAIRTEALPHLLDNRRAEAVLRIWVPGCATGEEVYSLGMCVLEALKERRLTIPIKIFATDVSESSIVRARAGAYPASISAEVSARRLREFFVKTDRGFRVQKTLRDLCVFARHDVTKDPPFSQLDLISCRNLLIYLGDGLQKAVIPIFHYALKPDGILVLGPAESVGPFGNLFVPIDKKWRLFRRTGVEGQSMLSYGPSASGPIAIRPPEARSEAMIRLADWHREADRVVLTKYAPPGVVIDDALHVMQYRGHTGAFLEPAPGAPTVHLLQMAREGLLPDLQAVIDEAKATGLPVRREHVRVKTNGRFQTYHLEAIPIALPLTSQRCMVVLFEPADAIASGLAPTQKDGTDRVKSDLPGESARQIAGLTQELAATKDYLQSVIEAKEAAHEEMMAANEEITSSNEELQSTNEELETAKEELQATNEELTTVNDELQVRIREATRANDDLTNLIDSIDIPILMLGADLELRRFSPGAQRILNLRPGDIGRHISDFKPRLDVPDFVPYLEEVGRTLKVEEREVRDDEGRWFKMCIRPYRTTDDKIEGATMSFFDIDALKQKELQLQVARDFARRIVEGLRGALLVLDDRLRVLFANKTFYELFQVTPDETEQQSVYGVGKGKLNTPQLRTLLEELLPANELLRDFRMEADLPALGRKALLINAQFISPLELQAQPPMILLSIEDVTEREKAERSTAIVETAAYAILTVDEATVIQSFNRAAEQMFGYPASDVIGQRLELLLPPLPGEDSNRSPDRFSGTGEDRTFSRTLIGRRRDGTMLPVDLAFGETVTAAMPLYTAILRDTSERRAAERQFLHASENEQRRVGQDLHDTAGQALIGLSYLAHGLAEELQEKDSPDAKVATRIVSELDRVLEQLRRIAKGMQPVQVDAEGLMAALSELAERTGAIGSAACTFECDQRVLLDDTQTATQLFLIAQEAVTNALRHARPTRIRIMLQEVQDLLRLEIVDDGNPAKTLQHPAGMGLKIMKYRADLIGATLAIEARRKGTAVVCAVDRRLVGGPRQPN